MNSTIFSQANKAFRKGDFLRACSLYEKAVKENPDLEAFVSFNLKQAKRNCSYEPQVKADSLDGFGSGALSISVCSIAPVSTGMLIHPYYGGMDVCAHEIAKEAYGRGFRFAMLPNPLKETWLDDGVCSLGSSGGGVPVLANRICGKGFAKDMIRHVGSGKDGVPSIWTDGIELLAKYNSEYKFDVIHTHYPQNMRVSRAVKKACPLVPFVATLHNGRIDQAYSIYDKLVFLTEGAKNQAEKEYPFVRDRGVVISPDVRREFMSPIPLDDNRRGFLFIGTMREGAPARKGLDLLLHAMSGSERLKRERLVVVGDGPERESYETMAQSMGLNCDFKGSLGPVEIVAEIDRASWFVMPSRHEPFGIVYLEAACRGVPIIGASDALREIESRIDHPVGIVFDPFLPGEIGRLANILEDALEGRTQLDVSSAGRGLLAKKVMAHFGHGTRSKNYCNLFLGMAGKIRSGLIDLREKLNPSPSVEEELLSTLPKSSFVILVQYSNSDAGLNALEGVIEVLRERLHGCVVVGVDMCDLAGNPTNYSRGSKIFDRIVSLSSYLKSSLRDGREPMRMEVAALFSRLFSRWKPSVAIVSNDRRWIEEELVTQLKWARIPVALLQESIRRDQTFPDYNRNHAAHGRGGCDLILAWGDQSVEYFKAVGVPAERIEVVGSPRLDRLIRTVRGLDAESVRMKIGLPSDSICILMTTSPMVNMTSITSSQFYGSIKLAFDAVSRSNERGSRVVLLFRHHRSEYGRMKRAGILDIIEKSDHLFNGNDVLLEECLAVADGVINYSSTIAIEAGLVGLPVGMLNLHGIDYGVDYVEKGVSKLISNEMQLQEFIGSIRLCAPADKKDLAYYVDCIDRSNVVVAEKVIGLARAVEENIFSNGLPMSIADELKYSSISIENDPATLKGWRIKTEGISDQSYHILYKYVTEQAVLSYENSFKFIEGFPLVDSGFFFAWPRLTSVLRRDRFEPLFNMFWHSVLIRVCREHGCKIFNIRVPLDPVTEEVLMAIWEDRFVDPPPSLEPPARLSARFKWDDMIFKQRGEVIIADYIFYTDFKGNAIRRYGSLESEKVKEGKRVIYFSNLLDGSAAGKLQSRFPGKMIFEACDFLNDEADAFCDDLADSIARELRWNALCKWKYVGSPVFKWFINWITKRLSKDVIADILKLNVSLGVFSARLGGVPVWVHKEAPIRQQPLAFTAAAHYRGHKVISVAPHVFTRYRHTNRFNVMPPMDCATSLIPDQFIVCSPFSRSELAAVGIDSDRIRVDDFYQESSNDVHREVSLSDDHCCSVLILLQNDYAHRAIIDSVFKAISCLDDRSAVKVFLRPHPAHPLAENNVQYVKHLGFHVCPPERTLNSCINGSDLVVTVYSSAGFQAKQFGVPVIWAAFNSMDAMFFIDLFDGEEYVAWSEEMFKDMLCGNIGKKLKCSRQY